MGQCDLRITDLAKKCPDIFSDRFLLITCLDSSTKVCQLSVWKSYLEKASIPHQWVSAGALIMPEGTARLFGDKKTFFGFDELYLLSAPPPREFKPDTHFTSDQCVFFDGVPDSVFVHLQKSGADGLLADGCGLNFAVTDLESAKKITNSK